MFQFFRLQGKEGKEGISYAKMVIRARGGGNLCCEEKERGREEFPMRGGERGNFKEEEPS